MRFSEKMKRHMTIGFAALILSLASIASAQPPETIPPGQAMYIMVLRVPAPASPGNPTGEKVKEPDVTKIGGSVRHRDANRRVIVIPIAAATSAPYPQDSESS